MGVGVLADLEFGEVEAERLGVPDHMLQLPVGSPSRTCLRQGVLHDPQVRDQRIGPRVGVLGSAGPRCLQTVGNDQHPLPMGFARGTGTDFREAFGHGDRVASQCLLQRTRRRGVGLVRSQGPPHPLDRDLQR